MNLFYIRKQGAKGAGCPFPLHPKSPPKLLRSAPDLFRLTIPNTYSTISTPASLRSDCCSPSSGMPFGFPPELAFTFTGIPTLPLREWPSMQ
jgi:hypothetical protein